MHTLKGRRALVCGGSRGIGRASAEELARLGAEVTVLARDREALSAVLAALATDPTRSHRLLVQDLDDLDGLVRTVSDDLAAHGPHEILVNNTGGPPPGPLLAAKPEEIANAHRRHVLASHVLAGLLVPGMRERRYGRIINIISVSVKEPIPGLGVSNTTRWAVAGWAKTLATELGPDGITVNNVLPGFTDTDRLRDLIARRAGAEGRTEAAVAAEMTATAPAGRFADPAETAAAVGFLASPAAAYVNGINLPIDGGRTRSL